MSSLPATLGSSTELAPRQMKAMEKAQRKAQVAVYQHWMGVEVQKQMDQIDAAATADAARHSLDEEIGLLNYGRHLAGTDGAALELAFRKVNVLAAINDSRIRRRFGN